MICEECHWFNKGKMDKPRSNGKIFPCLNVGMKGWEIWLDEQRPPEKCDNYCKIGEYVPTGAWAGVASVVQAVSEIAGCEE